MRCSDERAAKQSLPFIVPGLFNPGPQAMGEEYQNASAAECEANRRNRHFYRVASVAIPVGWWLLCGSLSILWGLLFGDEGGGFWVIAFISVLAASCWFVMWLRCSKCPRCGTNMFPRHELFRFCRQCRIKF